ncbi:MAG: ATP-dependent DNA helicase RecG, partial [Prevotella sp.]|nr:ATP-dependent DNA helicase RecG [Prevotella sp.]
QNFFPRARVRFIKYNGTEEKVGREMNVIKDVTFEGRILDQIQKTVEYLETQVKEHSYLGEDGLFKTDREYRSSVKELTVCRELFAIGTKEPQYHLVAFIMKATVWANVLEEGQETATSEQKQPDSNQIDSGTTQKLPRNYPETTQKQTLDITPVQEEIIIFILLNPYAGRKEISCSLGSLSEDGVKYNLKVLQHKGIIKRIGPNKGGYWKVLSDETGN